MPHDFCAIGILVSIGSETILSSGLLTILYGGAIVGCSVVSSVVLGMEGSMLFPYLSDK